MTRKFVLIFALVLVAAGCSNNAGGTEAAEKTLLESVTPEAVATFIPTNTPIPTATPATPERLVGIIHYVEDWENLTEIAERYETTVTDIVSNNGIANPNVLTVGQALKIYVLESKIPATKSIHVSLREQELYAYEDLELVKTFVVSTGGEGSPTPPGNYEIYGKHPTEDILVNGEIYPVSWVLYFQGVYALHGAPWNKNLGTPQSSGCVNLSVEDAQWIYHWAPLHTIVEVR